MRERWSSAAVLRCPLALCEVSGGSGKKACSTPAGPSLWEAASWPFCTHLLFPCQDFCEPCQAPLPTLWPSGSTPLGAAVPLQGSLCSPPAAAPREADACGVFWQSFRNFSSYKLCWDLVPQHVFWVQVELWLTKMCGCNNLFECCHVVKGDFYWLCLISSYCHSSLLLRQTTGTVSFHSLEAPRE